MAKSPENQSSQKTKLLRETAILLTAASVYLAATANSCFGEKPQKSNEDKVISPTAPPVALINKCKPVEPRLNGEVWAFDPQVETGMANTCGFDESAIDDAVMQLCVNEGWALIDGTVNTISDTVVRKKGDQITAETVVTFSCQSPQQGVQEETANLTLVYGEINKNGFANSLELIDAELID